MNQNIYLVGVRAEKSTEPHSESEVPLELGEISVPGVYLEMVVIRIRRHTNKHESLELHFLETGLRASLKLLDGIKEYSKDGAEMGV